MMITWVKKLGEIMRCRVLMFMALIVKEKPALGCIYFDSTELHAICMVEITNDNYNNKTLSISTAPVLIHCTLHYPSAVYIKAK